MKFFSARFARFLAVGVANTLITYAIYLAANLVLDYRWAYTVSFVLGIGISYLLNTWFVFRQPFSLAKLLAFPLVYAVQYIVGLLLVWLFVDRMGLDETFAPLAAVPLTLPLTYVLSRAIINRRSAP